MTFSTLLDDLKARCAYTESDLDTTFKGWLNRGQDNLQTRYLWPFFDTEGTVTTASSTETYDLPTDLRYLLDVRDTTNDQIIKPISIAKFYRRVPDPSATGAPYLFRLPGSTQSAATSALIPQISFYPIPGGTYTVKVHYYRRLVDLSGSTDIPAFPAEYHEMLIHYAAAIYFLREGDSRTATHQQSYENYLASMVEQYSGQPADKLEVLGSTDDDYNIPIVRLPAEFGQMNWE